jgi:hypothetical protein
LRSETNTKTINENTDAPEISEVGLDKDVKDKFDALQFWKQQISKKRNTNPKQSIKEFMQPVYLASGNNFFFFEFDTILNS